MPRPFRLPLRLSWSCRLRTRRRWCSPASASFWGASVGPTAIASNAVRRAKLARRVSTRDKDFAKRSNTDASKPGFLLCLLDGRSRPQAALGAVLDRACRFVHSARTSFFLSHQHNYNIGACGDNPARSRSMAGRCQSPRRGRGRLRISGDQRSRRSKSFAGYSTTLRSRRTSCSTNSAMNVSVTRPLSTHMCGTRAAPATRTRVRITKRMARKR